MHCIVRSRYLHEINAAIHMAVLQVCMTVLTLTSISLFQYTCKMFGNCHGDCWKLFCISVFRGELSFAPAILGITIVAIYD